jgi:cell division protease FtsH
MLVPGTDPVHKVTIIPRGRALGLTQYLPEDDRYTHDRRYIEARLAVLLGGRVAEEVALKHMTTGAGNDLERATDLARKMVTEWGMSDNMGPLTYGKKDEQIFLGREIAQHKDYSEHTAEQIDAEVKLFVMNAYERATKILTEHYDKLEKLAEELLDKETMDADEIYALVGMVRPPSMYGPRKVLAPDSPVDSASASGPDDSAPKA